MVVKILAAVTERMDGVQQDGSTRSHTGGKLLS